MLITTGTGIFSRAVPAQ